MLTIKSFLPNIYLLALLAVIDRLVLTPLITLRLGAGKTQRRDVSATRWFFLHAFANLLVCATALPALIATFADPHSAMDSRVYDDTSLFGTASIWPLAIVNSVHIYHMVGGFMLNSADYFHHLLFVPTCGFPGQLLPWGAVEPAGAFFISGLPGGVSYFLLGLQKVGKLQSITEKRVTANINTWVRTPGILFTSFVVYQGMVYARHTLPLWAVALQTVLPLYNALYYNKQAVANYTVHFLNALLKQDEQTAKIFDRVVNLPPGSMSSSVALAWKEACGVPQRGS